MSFVIYNPETKTQVGCKVYPTERGARIALGRAKITMFEVASYEEFLTLKTLTKKKIKVRSLMTDQEVEIDEDTPLCCDPSSETYWSM